MPVRLRSGTQVVVGTSVVVVGTSVVVVGTSVVVGAIVVVVVVVVVVVGIGTALPLKKVTALAQAGAGRRLRSTAASAVGAVPQLAGRQAARLPAAAHCSIWACRPLMVLSTQRTPYR